MIAVHISVYGEVQGTGFRTWSKEQAEKLNLSGWTRKASDGSIEIFSQGEEEKINDFVSFVAFLLQIFPKIDLRLNLTAIYIFNIPILSPFWIGASIGPS